MQLGSVYLYPNRLDVYTNLEDWLQERYRQVYQRNLKLYRGVSNKVEFRVKNSDQKPTPITNRVFVFRLISRETQELLIKKDCVLVDASIGKIYLELSEFELQYIEPAMYQYSLTYETRESRGDYYVVTSTGPTYIDSQYGANGTVEILSSISGEPQSSYTTKEFKKYTDLVVADDYYLSGVVQANSELVTPDSLHTFQLYFTNFTGRVTLQGSLDQGGDPQTWANIQSVDYTNATSEYINVVGKYNWFRFRFQPNFNNLLGDFVVNQTIFGYYNVTVNTPGRNYSIGDTILVKGNRLGGETPANDLLITVTGVNANGGITAITNTGWSYNGVSQYIIGPTTEMAGTFDKFIYR